MTRRQLTVWGVIAFVVLIVLGNTFFVVDQRQSAIVLRLGEPVRVIHAPGRGGAGLNVKTPFLEQVIKIDRRNLGLEADQEEVISADQERLVVDDEEGVEEHHQDRKDDQSPSDELAAGHWSGFFWSAGGAWT